MTAEDLISQLENDYIQRLKWFVLREFKVLPCSDDAKKLSDEDVIMCGAHMVLDRRMCSDVSECESSQNGSFDEARFARLSEGRL
ncbi:MAG: hypothetical protein GX488_08275 [Clostridiales bacterium]|nr:hypothetical protein [Clostridiales bacterium]